MSERHDATRALLDAVRRVQDPTERERKQLNAKMVERVGAEVFGAPFSAAGPLLAPPAAAAGASVFTKKVLVVISVLGLAAGGTAVGVRTLGPSHDVRAQDIANQVAPAEQVEAVPAQAPAAEPPPLPTAPSVAAPDIPEAVAVPLAGSARAKRPSVGRGSAPATPSASIDLDAELALVGQAQSALGRGDARAALALTDEHASKFPKGQLSRERERVRTLALCALGSPEGRARAEAFLRANPTSPMADRLRQACRIP
jgi:hypothetical protein